MARDRPADTRTPGPPSRLGTRLVVVAILLVGFSLRVWRLDTIPPGFHVDEAYNLIDARAILAGWRPVFLPDNAGREVLYSYLQALMMAGIGATPWAARLTSALVGTATLALVFVLARRQTWTWAGRNFAGVVPTAFVALSYWHLHFSRFGIRAVVFPAVVALSLWAWWRAFSRLVPGSGRGAAARQSADSAAGWRDGGIFLWILALALAAGSYAHPAGRILVLVPLFHAAWYAATTWRTGRAVITPLQAVCAAYAGSLVFIVPLVAYWWIHPWTFAGHLQEVSILGQGWRALLDNALRTVGMFFAHGDDAPWRNLPGQPVFYAWRAVVFTSFVVCLSAAWLDSQYNRLLLVAVVVLMAPTALALDAPNFSRAIGLIPVVYVVGAIVVDAILFGVPRAGRLGNAGRSFAFTALTLFAVLYYPATYFDRWATGEQTAEAVDDDKVALARYLNAEEAAGRFVYLSHDVESAHQAGMVEHATVRALAEHALRGFDPRFGFVLPPSGTDGAFVLVAAEDGVPGAWTAGAAAESARAPLLQGVRVTALADQLRRLQSPPLSPPRSASDGVEAAGERDGPSCALITWLGISRYAQYLIRCDLQSAALRARLADPAPSTFTDRPTWGNAIRLVGGRIPGQAKAGEDLPITLVWECRQPIAADYSTAIQLVTPDGAVSLGSGDGPPLGGSFPTSAWRAGELVVSDYTLRVAPDARPGQTVLRVGWYDLARAGDPAGSLYAPGGRQVVAVAGMKVVPAR